MKTKEMLAGRVLSGIVTLALAGSGIAKLAGAHMMVDGLVRAGIPASAIVPIALLEMSCLALYLMPRTVLLGTLLLTGYFGGATVTHLIAGESLLPPLMIGLMIWGGAYWRAEEFQEWVPLRGAKTDWRGSENERATQRAMARG
jgi:DoxX-like protein